MEAQLALGILYEYGTLGADGRVRPDYAAASRWYQKAADRGEKVAMYYLAHLADRGLGRSKDPRAAFDLYERAAEAGHVPSMVRVGEMYVQGDVGPREPERAVPWFQKAIAAGDGAALLDMGVLFHTGKGVLQNFEKAMQLYRAAAEKQNCVALLNIGGMYFNGDGVGQSKAEAQRWFAKAQACKGTKFDDMDAIAARYGKRASEGRLPRSASEPEHGDGPSLEGVVAAGLALAIVAALVADSDAPAGGGDDDRYENARRADLDRRRAERDQAESLCRLSGNPLACGSAMVFVPFD